MHDDVKPSRPVIRARCVTCGAKFPARRADARYCSGRCRQRANRARQEAPTIDAAPPRLGRLGAGSGGRAVVVSAVVEALHVEAPHVTVAEARALSDGELARVAPRNATAFALLYERRSDFVLRRAQVYTWQRARHLAEDVAAEVWLLLARGRWRLKDGHTGPLWAFLDRVVRNVARQQLEQWQRRPTVSLDAPHEADDDDRALLDQLVAPFVDPIEPMLRDDQIRRLRRALGTLDARAVELLRWYYCDQLTMSAIQPWRMRVDRDARRRLRFTYHTAGGTTTEWLYDPHRPPLLRLHVHSLDGVTGRSVIQVLRESLGLTIQLQRFGAKFFKDGVHVAGVLSYPDDLDPDQKKDVRESVETFHAGTEKAHRTLVVSGGAKYDQLGAPLEDMQFLESRKFQRSELCGAFAVPLHMAGDLERATFSNIESESLRWLRDGLDPHLVNWESAIRRDCLGPRAFDHYYPRFVRNAAVRGDLRSRSEALQIQRRNGVISANEWRALEEMDPITAAQGGDDYLVIGGGAATTPGGDTPPAE